MNLLLTRPRHDIPTHYLFSWTAEIITAAEAKTIQVVDLLKEKARKKTLQSYLRKGTFDLVIMNGHGNATSVGGHNNEILVSIRDGADLFRDKIVFVGACDAGTALGPEIMRNGRKDL